MVRADAGTPGTEDTGRSAGNAEGPGPEVTWGVGAVASRLEVAASTLRTWERRYGVGPSHRTRGGHRRYTERDIDRVELMRRMVGRGVSAQDAARVARHLDRDELAMALSDEKAGAEVVEPSDLVSAMNAAVLTGDIERLKDLGTVLLAERPFRECWRDVLSPLLVQLAGERARGSLDGSAHGDAMQVVADLVAARGRDQAALGRTQVVAAATVPDVAALPWLAVTTGLAEAGVVIRTVGPEASWRRVLDLAGREEPDVLVVWDVDLPESELRRHADSADGLLVRLTPGWPQELCARFGSERRAAPQDVATVVERVLDVVV